MLSTTFSTAVENSAVVGCTFRMEDRTIHTYHQVIHRICGSLNREAGGLEKRKAGFSWRFVVSTGFAASVSCCFESAANAGDNLGVHQQVIHRVIHKLCINP